MKYKYIVLKASLPDCDGGSVVNIKTCDNPEEALSIKDNLENNKEYEYEFYYVEIILD